MHELAPGTHFFSIFLFSSLLNKLKPDCILCRCGTCPITGVLAALLTARCGKVVIAYDSFFILTSSIGTRLRYYGASLLSRLSHCTICVSSDILNELKDRFKASSKKLRVIYNPVDLEEVHTKNQELLPASLWADRKERLFILAVGRFVEEKDYPTLIRAFHNIHREIPHDLIILGQGPLKDDIRALVKELSLQDRVILPGFLQNPFPFFRAASLFVLSSIYEGFGNVIIEALATGTPVVSTNCPGGAKEILENGKYGTLTPVGDDKALAESIRLTLNDPLPAEILQKRADDFSLDKIASQYQRIFDTIG